MQTYLVAVSGSASIHVIANDDDEAVDIIHQLCSSELDADRYKSLDEYEVAAVQSLTNWEILGVWEDYSPDDQAPAESLSGQ